MVHFLPNTGNLFLKGKLFLISLGEHKEKDGEKL